MRFTVLIGLITISYSCYAQDNYGNVLTRRLDQIRQLDTFDNGIVLHDWPGWIPWESDLNFYEKDIVTFKYATYLAIADSKGVIPGTAPKTWKVIRGPHPYLFLRDSAKVDDLRKLLTSDHTWIKTYSFAALAYRKIDDNLFNVIIQNMPDTTQISQFSSDVIEDMYPAEMMIEYLLHDLTRKQKQTLNSLIDTQYKHLEQARRLLEEK